MSNTSLDLLRMLEPAVRPVSPDTAGRAASPETPFEAKDFDALLEQAKQWVQDVDAVSVETESAAEPTPQVEPLNPLSKIDAVHNASLRQIIERNGG